MAIKRLGPQSKFRHLRSAYRSGLEATVAAALALAGVPFAYEPIKLPFTQPEKKRNYTPDIILNNGLVVELKGLFTLEDRQKHLWIKEQHPNLEVAFVFSNPNAKLSKGSPTTYANWAEKHGYKYAKKEIPASWYTAPENPVALKALETLGWKPSS